MQKVDTLSYRLIYPGDRARSQMLRIQYLTKQINSAMKRELEKKDWKLNQLNAQLLANRIDIAKTFEYHNKQAINLNISFTRLIESRLRNIQSLNSQLTQLNPQSVLARGYSMVFNTQEGTLIRNSKQIKPDDDIQVKFADGSCDARIIKTYRSSS